MRYTRVLEIVGDIMKVQVVDQTNGSGVAARFGDLAIVESGADTLGRRF